MEVEIKQLETLLSDVLEWLHENEEGGDWDECEVIAFIARLLRAEGVPVRLCECVGSIDREPSTSATLLGDYLERCLEWKGALLDLHGLVDEKDMENRVIRQVVEDHRGADAGRVRVGWRSDVSLPSVLVLADAILEDLPSMVAQQLVSMRHAQLDMHTGKTHKQPSKNRL